MKRSLALALFASLMLPGVSAAGPESDAPASPAAEAARKAGRTLTHSVELGAPPAAIFKDLTTSEGIRRLWSVAQADVDFRVGGQIRTRYDDAAPLGAPGTIINTILAYEPDRMLAIKATAPEGAPPPIQRFAEKCWTVLRLEPAGSDGSRTRLTCTSLGFGHDPVDDQAYQHFDAGNRWTLDNMKKAYPVTDSDTSTDAAGAMTPANMNAIELDRFVAAGRVPVEIRKQVTIAATPDRAFDLFTTGAGFKAFLGVDSNVDLRIGGPMELFFGANFPPGQRGSDGCQILAYDPGRMLAFSWNAPPKFPAEREKRTWVVLHFTGVEPDRTRVELHHMGFGPSGEGHWDDVRAYFDRAWGSVLKALEMHAAGE